MKRRTAINCLKKSGVKPSLQRIAILDYLLSHATHPAVDEIYETLVKDIPTLSRTTVYNTLHLFAENGLATQMAFHMRISIVVVVRKFLIYRFLPECQWKEKPCLKILK